MFFTNYLKFTEKGIHKDLFSLFVVKNKQTKKQTNDHLSTTPNFVFCGQKTNEHLGRTLKISYFVVKELMAARMAFGYSLYLAVKTRMNVWVQL